MNSAGPGRHRRQAPNQRRFQHKVSPGTAGQNPGSTLTRPPHSPTGAGQTKAAIRREVRAVRRALPASQRVVRAEAMCRHLARSPLLNNAHRIALFIGNDGEMTAEPLVAQPRWQNKRFYLPVIFGRAQRRRLRFARYSVNQPLVRNRYGIPEPSKAGAQWLSPRFLDLVLVPLVAFDDHGHRLGMGGGFYDRTFAFLKHRLWWRKPRLIGLAYDFQHRELVPSDPWDVPLSGVATESGLRLVRPHRPAELKANIGGSPPTAQGACRWPTG